MRCVLKALWELRYRRPEPPHHAATEAEKEEERQGCERQETRTRGGFLASTVSAQSVNVLGIYRLTLRYNCRSVSDCDGKVSKVSEHGALRPQKPKGRLGGGGV